MIRHDKIFGKKVDQTSIKPDISKRAGLAKLMHRFHYGLLPSIHNSLIQRSSDVAYITTIR